MTPRASLTLGLYPESKGLGWIVFENPLSPHDWGTMRARRGDKNAQCMGYVEYLFDKFEPEAVILEAFERRSSARSSRVAKLCRAILGLCASRAIEVAIYTRGDVKASFRELGATSRQQIADAIGRHIPALRPLVPKPRKLWSSEHPRMAIFSAAALVLTYYRHLSARLLEDLKSAEIPKE